MRTIYFPILFLTGLSACVGALDPAVDAVDTQAGLSEAFVNSQVDRYCDETLPEERALILVRLNRMSSDYDFVFNCENRSVTRVAKAAQ